MPLKSLSRHVRELVSPYPGSELSLDWRLLFLRIFQWWSCPIVWLSFSCVVTQFAVSRLTIVEIQMTAMKFKTLKKLKEKMGGFSPG